MGETGQAIAAARLAELEGKAERRVAVALTQEQVTLLQWIADGKQNSDIATIIGVRPITIQTRVGKIFDQLGVCTRSAAVAFGFRNGLLK